MSPDRLRAVLGLLRWSQRGLAEAVSCDDRLVRRWASSAASVPSDIAAWFDTPAEFHGRHPPPTGWCRRSAA